MHWGEIVLRYWSEIHNRELWCKGTAVNNYVHYGDAYDNAFWNGTAMYGDGSYQGGTTWWIFALIIYWNNVLIYHSCSLGANDERDGGL
jgi:Zn-dependent metalloprotease